MSKPKSLRIPKLLWLAVAAVLMVVLWVFLAVWFPYHSEQAAIREIERSGGSVGVKEEQLEVVVGESPPQKTFPTAPTSQSRASLREAILRNMPVNIDKRCVGISIVTEALLDGDRLDGDRCDDAADIAQRIYGNLTTGRQLLYHPYVMIDDTRVQIDSPATIEKLSTLVTDYYKKDYYRLSKTEKGLQKLTVAQNSFVATSDELDRILDLEPDKMDAFFGSGFRVYPDRSRKESHHVVLIGKRVNGDKYVYDSNAPGSPIVCQLVNTENGVTVRWSCQYKDTGQITTQRYLIVHKDKFFSNILSE